MTNINIELTTDQEDEITRHVLIDSYRVISHLEPERVKFIKSLRKVIKHYSTPTEWEEFCEEFDIK